jgi:MGT family glycosyltransferase
MRVLFCSFTSPGHLFPLVGLALELRRRGHQVAFATGRDALDTLHAVEMERIPRGARDGDSFALDTWHAPLRTAVDAKHVQHGIRRFGPDLLVTHQLCQAPLLVREMEGIPVAVMGLFSYLWPVAHGADATRFAALQPTRQWRIRDAVGILNQARELFRLAPAEEAAALLGDLFILRTVPELESEREALPACVHPVGACLWEPPRTPGAWDALRDRFPDPDAPVVYVQQGRTFRGPGFWARLVEDLADQPVQVVASTSRMDQPVGNLPANFLVEGHVPQGLVLPHAAAVVSGGNTTAVLGALAHGVPAVVVPGGGETADNAQRLAAAGCAQILRPEELAPGTLRTALEQVVQDGVMGHRCRSMQAAFARMGTFRPAAALVESLAGQPQAMTA